MCFPTAHLICKSIVTGYKHILFDSASNHLSLLKKGYKNSTSLTFVQSISTVLLAKSDSEVMFCLQIYQDLESIDYLCINPIHRIGLIHKRAIDSH